MTPRETLEFCRSAVDEIAAIEHQLDRLRGIGGPRSLGAVSTESMSRTNNPESARLQHEDYLCAELEKQRDRIEATLAAANALVNSLADGRARSILRYYYLVGWNDDRIADEMGISRTWVCKKRVAAVRFLEKKYRGVHTSSH